MLKKLTIRNFKAIQDMTIEFTPLTVLIGGNGCGKSTVLQALDFLRAAATRDIPEYLRERGWGFDELKSKLSRGQDKPIEFMAFFEFKIENEFKTIEWRCSVDFQDKKWIVQEDISSNDRTLVSVGNTPKTVYGQVWDFKDFPFENIKLESSSLKIMDDSFFTVAFGKDSLMALKKFMTASEYFGLLSPESIKSGYNPPYIENIGIGGSMLAAYISEMNQEQRKKLNDIVSDVMGSKTNIEAVKVGNRIELSIREYLSGNTVETVNIHISDGLLRIIAFIVIMLETEKTYFVSESMVLLDEIEDGINPYLTEKIILLLREFVLKSGRQLILTTHSPVMLNDFKPEEIVFLWKDKNGSVHARNFFDTKKMREALDFLNPGEIWENYGRDTILIKLDVPPEDR
jgi:predicted ATPase